MNQWKRDLSAFIEYVLWAIALITTLSALKKVAFAADMKKVLDSYKEVVDHFQFPIDLIRKKDPFKASRKIANDVKTRWGG